MVCYVSSKIGWYAVISNKHFVLLTAYNLALNPQCPVLFNSAIVLLEKLNSISNLTRLVKCLFREPNVKVYSIACKTFLDSIYVSRKCKVYKNLSSFFWFYIDILIAMYSSKVLHVLSNVLAMIAVFREFYSVFTLYNLNIPSL